MLTQNNRIYKRQRRERDRRQLLLMTTGFVPSPPSLPPPPPPICLADGRIYFDSTSRLHLPSGLHHPGLEYTDAHGERQSSSQNLPGPSQPLSYFFCQACSIPRSTKLIYDGICVYCFDYQQKYCMFGDHEDERHRFLDRDGDEHVRCNKCREYKESDQELDTDIDKGSGEESDNEADEESSDNSSDDSSSARSSSGSPDI